ncbi:MAG TPA: Asp-tRNA(Asn)/Glu-tRNA(Gln) amidotransferase subunit GatC [Gemmatimonadaceae bacterium]|nr:Asp-tRNA(Asn)/Glu-tRNA(Gln) amidotransferase subunit GatC [Gemmatimonadaceae bacterium]
MSISLDEVRHVASLARLGITDERARVAAVELSSILQHMDVLSKVDTSDVTDLTTLAQSGMILRPDTGPPIPLERAPADFVPALRDGFILVPRLATHEDPEPAP